MRRKDNFKAVNDLRKMLTETKRLTLENYILQKRKNHLKMKCQMMRYYREIQMI